MFGLGKVAGALTGLGKAAARGVKNGPAVQGGKAVGQGFGKIRDTIASRGFGNKGPIVMTSAETPADETGEDDAEAQTPFKRITSRVMKRKAARGTDRGRSR